MPDSDFWDKVRRDRDGEPVTDEPKDDKTRIYREPAQRWRTEDGQVYPPDEPKLTEAELADVESSATDERDDKTGTPINGADPAMVLRLVAEVRRLRQLVRGADKLLTPGVAGKLPQKQVEEIYDAIKNEAERG